MTEPLKEIEDIIAACEDYIKKKFSLFGKVDEDALVNDMNTGLYVIVNGKPMRGTGVENLIDGYTFNGKDYGVYVENDRITFSNSFLGGVLVYEKNVSGQTKLVYYLRATDELNEITKIASKLDIGIFYDGEKIGIEYFSPGKEEKKKLAEFLRELGSHH